MGYQIRNYNEWKSSTRTNEGLMSALKDVSSKFLNMISKIPGLSWVGDRFKGDGSWYLNLYMRSKTEGPSKGINLYPSKTTEKLVNAAIKEEGTSSVKKTEESLHVHSIDEAKVPTTHPNPRIRSVDYKGFLKKIERIVVAKKNGISGNAKLPPYLIWGAPGVGKSQLIEGIAKKYDMDFIEVILSQVPPDNLLLPKEDPETGLGDTIPSGSLPVYDSRSPNAAKLEAEKNGIGLDGKPRGGILFFDEISRAPKPNLNAALQIIEARRIDKWKIASEWIIIAAANREEDDDAMYQFSTAMGNRFAQINLVPHLEQWIEYQKTRLDPETGRMIMDPEMIEFLRFNKELFHDMDPDVSPEIFPTPRAWEKAGDAVSIMRKVAELEGETLTLGEIEDQVADLLGTDVAKQYVAYLNLVRSIDPKTLKQVYSDQKKAALPPKEKGDYRSDAASAMITAIILDRRGDKLTDKEFRNVTDYAVRLGDPTLATILMRRLLEEHPYANFDSKKFDEEGYGETFDYIMDSFLSKYKRFDREYKEVED